MRTALRQNDTKRHASGTAMPAAATVVVPPAVPSGRSESWPRCSVRHFPHCRRGLERALQQIFREHLLSKAYGAHDEWHEEIHQKSPCPQRLGARVTLPHCWRECNLSHSRWGTGSDY